MADYNSYFTLSTRESLEAFRNTEKRQDIYREHLNSVTKSELIDVALEGHALYTSANDLAYNRGLEINNLKTEVESLNTRLTNNIAVTNKKVNNYKTACFVTIGICALSISVFYIYQYIKYRLKKYADKIRSETIEEINKSH